MAANEIAIKAILSNYTTGNWRQACDALIDYLISEGECFSSGEIARLMRLHNPNLMFSVPNLGEHVRDLFYSGGMKHYPDDGYGGTTYPIQVPRTTQGVHQRTPAGIQVFVYCPEAQKGFAHDFEVDIPRGGGVQAPAQPQPAPAAPGWNPPPKQPVQITGAKAPQTFATLTAKVHDDRRLCVPRSAFELYVHFTGQPMKGGDPVFVRIDPDKVTINLTDPNDGQAKSYDLGLTRGRVRVTSPNAPFNPGDTYSVTVGSDGLTVDITKTV